jgi:hypothetical protein
MMPNSVMTAVRGAANMIKVSIVVPVYNLGRDLVVLKGPDDRPVVHSVAVAVRAPLVQRSIRKHTVLAISIIVDISLLGAHLPLHAHAEASYLVARAITGTPVKATHSRSARSASGHQRSRVAGTAQSFKSAVSEESISFAANKGSYGSLANLASKGYKQFNIGQVADAAMTATKQCKLETVDRRLDWNNNTTCQAKDPAWSPQAISGSGSSGWSDRSDIMLVSWNNAGDVRSRLTVVNQTTNKQVFVDLVRPCHDAGGYCWLSSKAAGACSTTHAGGIAWYRNHLFVADDECIIVFDLNTLFQDSNRVVLPTTGYWRQTSAALKYNNIALDTSGPTPQLIVGESNRPTNHDNTGCEKEYFARWDLDPITTNLKLDAGSTTKASSERAYSTTICQLQGIAYYKGEYIMSTFKVGEGVDYTYRVRTSASGPPDTRYRMQKSNTEGIYLDTSTNWFWTLTEHAGTDGNTRIYSWKADSMLDRSMTSTGDRPAH